MEIRRGRKSRGRARREVREEQLKEAREGGDAWRQGGERKWRRKGKGGG